MADERALRILHRIWAAMLAGVVVLAVLVVVLADAHPDELPPVLPAALVVAVGAAAFAGVVAVDRVFLAGPPSDDAAAVADYRVRFLLQAAIVEAPFVLSVIMAFVLGPPWVVLVGAGAAVAALLRVRPSLARLRRIDATWRANGQDVSLLRALSIRDDH